jgi:hypothetical protein
VQNELTRQIKFKHRELIRPDSNVRGAMHCNRHLSSTLNPIIIYVHRSAPQLPTPVPSSPGALPAWGQSQEEELKLLFIKEYSAQQRRLTLRKALLTTQRESVTNVVLKALDTQGQATPYRVWEEVRILLVLYFL